MTPAEADLAKCACGEVTVKSEAGLEHVSGHFELIGTYLFCHFFGSLVRVIPEAGMQSEWNGPEVKFDILSVVAKISLQKVFGNMFRAISSRLVPICIDTFLDLWLGQRWVDKVNGMDQRLNLVTFHSSNVEESHLKITSKMK